MQNNLLSIGDLAEWVWKTIFGTVTAIFGYFLPVKDLVHMVILFFIVDMLIGYWAARRLRGEKFSTKIIWKTTVPRLLISLVLIIMAFIWDTTCKQTYFPTYNIISWFISGILIFSIGKNAYSITNWEGFRLLSLLFRKKIKDQTGINVPKNLILIISFLLLTSSTPTRVRVADKAEYKRYLEYCEKMIPVRTMQEGKIKVQLVNGQYTDSVGHFTPVQPIQPYWYPIGAKKIVVEKNEVLIYRHLAVWQKQRKSSVRDFYEWWMKDGKAGNR